MGVASYWRGSRAISLQYEMDRYKADPTGHNPTYDYKPEPRPAGWGGSTAERARLEVEKIVARNAEYRAAGNHAAVLDRTWAIHFVRERARCGKATAEAAVDGVGEWRSNNNNPEPP